MDAELPTAISSSSPTTLSASYSFCCFSPGQHTTIRDSGGATTGVCGGGATALILLPSPDGEEEGGDPRAGRRELLVAGLSSGHRGPLLPAAEAARHPEQREEDRQEPRATKLGLSSGRRRR